MTEKKKPGPAAIVRFFHLTTVSSFRKKYTISDEPEMIKKGKMIKQYYHSLWWLNSTSK
jgi:hypothetical protein